MAISRRMWKSWRAAESARPGGFASVFEVRLGAPGEPAPASRWSLADDRADARRARVTARRRARASGGSHPRRDVDRNWPEAVAQRVPGARADSLRDPDRSSRDAVAGRPSACHCRSTPDGCRAPRTTTACPTQSKRCAPPSTSRRASWARRSSRASTLPTAGGARRCGGGCAGDGSLRRNEPDRVSPGWFPLLLLLARRTAAARPRPSRGRRGEVLARPDDRVGDEHRTRTEANRDRETNRPSARA